VPTYKANKSGYYKRTITVGKHPDGRPLEVAIRSKSLTEFKELVKEAENRRDHGYDFEAKDMTVTEWSAKWLEVYKKPHVRDHCYQTYEINLRLHILPTIGYMKMTEIRPFDLQGILNAQKGKSKSNTQKIRFAIQQIFHRAYLDGIIIKDISEELRMPETTEGERRPLTDVEKKAVLEVAGTHRAGLWVLSMLYAGLRPEETVPLMWSDIDLTVGNEAITVRRAAEWKNGRAQIKGLKGKDNKKGKEKERTIPIPVELSERFRTEPRKGLYVFTPAQSSEMLTQTNCRRMWSSFQREVDIAMGAKLYRNAITVHVLDQGVTPYYLRHTYCTSLFEIGVDLKTAQYLMGHSDVKTTANIYTHFMDKSLDKVGATIREKLGTGQTLDKTNVEKLSDG
jgi:integrase